MDAQRPAAPHQPSHRYAAASPQQLADLTQQHPLAWVVCTTPQGPVAAVLPLLTHLDAAGRITRVEGHLASANPLVAALRGTPQALLLWLGPQGYVSPSWMADRTQAPSWNYASLQCHVQVQLQDDPVPLRAHLDALVATHEAGRACPWAAAEMGARYEQLAARIVAFSATPTAQRERFKLGQDERDDVYADILTGLAGLSSPPAAALAEWMQRSNPGRPDRDKT